MIEDFERERAIYLAKRALNLIPCQFIWNQHTMEYVCTTCFLRWDETVEPKCPRGHDDT